MKSFLNFEKCFAIISKTKKTVKKICMGLKMIEIDNLFLKLTFHEDKRRIQ